MDMEQAAVSLYSDKATPATAPAPAPQPTAEERAIDSLWGEKSKREAPPPPAEPEGPTPEQIDAAEQAEHARLIEANYGAQLRDLTNAATERLGMDPDEAQASAQEWGGIFRDHDLAPKDVAQLVEAGVAVHARGVSEEQATQWIADAQDTLRKEHGPDGAKTALALARQLVAKDPRLSAYLDRTGLGNHPDVVRVVAARARQLQAKGKL